MKGNLCLTNLLEIFDVVTSRIDNWEQGEGDVINVDIRGLSVRSYIGGRL